MLVQTETGLQYLMLLKNKKLLSQKYSIVVTEDEYTFCGLVSLSSLKIDKNETSNKINIKNWIEKNSIKDTTQIIVSNSPALFVPHVIYDADLSKNYYEKFDTLNSSDSLSTDQSTNHINSIIYKISKSINLLKEVYLVNSDVVHYQTILYDYLIRKNKNSTSKKLYINIHKYSFDIFLFFGEQLQLVNRFIIKGSNSFLYFLYFIIEKNNLKENEFSICFLGNYLSFEQYYNSAKLFHEKVEFISIGNNKNVISSSPFLIQLNANNIRNS